VEKGQSAGRAGQALLTAYPDDRQREHAARWLGWIAYHMGDRASFGAGNINGWVPRGWLRLAGFLRTLPAVCCVAGAIYLGVSRWGVLVLVLVGAASPFLFAFLAVILRALDRRAAVRGPGGGRSTGQAELALLLLRRQRIRFRPLLADAVDRSVLRRPGSAYTFADPATATALAAPYQARAADRAREQATLAARPGARSTLIAYLTDNRRNRLSVDFGAGAAVLVFPAFPAAFPDVARPWWILVPQFVILVSGIGFMATLAAWIALTLLRCLARWSLRNVPGLSRRRRLFVLLVAAAAAGVLVAAAGRPLALAVAFTLPAACVAACGLWLGIVVFQKTRGKARWLRLLPDAIGAVTTAAAFLALCEHNLLTALPATGLLFPVAVWGSIRVWLAMKASDRVFSRAGADVTLSLLLGAVMVLLLVWLANLFGMSRPEVAALRAVLGHVGAAADVPWWAWLAVYLALAAVSLAIVLRPARMANVRRWQQRLRVVFVTEALRRTLSGVHIGLLMIVLIGAGASAVLPSALQHELAVAYTVALQRQLLAEGELAAYTEIRQQLAVSGHQGTLTQVVAGIHHDDPPPPGDDNATSSEDDLAQRVGALQAATLGLNNAQAIALAEAAEARARSTGLDAPVRDKGDLTGRLAETGNQEQSSGEAEASAQQAGELAAKVIATTISIPDVGSNEVLQVVREYLSSLVEDSGVAGTFADWAQRLPGGVTPPAAAALVEPDPTRLEQAAQQELKAAYNAAGNPGGLDDDPSYLEQDSLPAVENAVDMTNQSVQVSGGSCCAVPGEDDEPPPPVEGGE
jgi:hypothetical protein